MAVTLTLALPDGKRKYFRGETKKEAEDKRTRFKIENGIGDVSEMDPTFKQIAEVWFETYKKDQLHKRSEETIRGTLERYIIPTLGFLPIKDIKPLHIKRLMNRYKDYSKSTQRKILQYTKAILRMAAENGMIPLNPVTSEFKPGGADPKEKVPLTHEQTDRLLAALEGTRAHLLVNVLLESGLRIGEALGLQWSDINFKEGTISVNRSIVFPADNQKGEINEDLKTDNARRTIPIPWELANELMMEKNITNSIWVFSKQNGEHLSYSSFKSLWKMIDFRTKGSEGKREFVERTLDFDVHPHLLRHTCITRWFESGLDLKEVQYLAGHASVEITLKIYTHYLEAERAKETANKIQKRKINYAWMQ